MTDEEQPLSEEEPQQSKRRMSPFGRLFRFFGWWFGFTGLYSVFAVGPICGQQGCPASLASAGNVGVFSRLVFRIEDCPSEL